ncbi:MAG: ribose 5-phosphate isomerase B [Terriglobales bacterium]
MKVAIGADHAGFELKERIRNLLADQGIEVVDEGTHSADSVDYPDYARKVAESVARSEAQRGILVCGSGIGMAMAANKVHGIRAAHVTSEQEARLSREHNDANVLTLGARFLDDSTAQRIVQTFLDTRFVGGRHQRRVEKIAAIEREEAGKAS